jgi:hypothetical protein
MSGSRLRVFVAVFTAIVAVAATDTWARAQPSEEPAALHGLVIDALTGQPVAGALVRIITPESSTLTDEEGRFAFVTELPGRVTLQVVMLGYALIEREVDAGRVATGVTIALTEAPPSYSERVEVRGDAFPVHEAATPSEIAIGSADLALLRGVLADDPFRAVQAMPGVASGDDFTAEFAIRGSGHEHIGVLVDGVPAPVVLHTVQGRNDTGSVSMINSDVLASVAASGGSYPQRTGNRTGAEVDFTTREGSRERTQMRAQVGAAIASIVGEGPLGSAGRGSWLVAGRASYAGWIVRRIDPSATTTFTFLDVNAKLTWDPAPRHQTSLVLIAGRMDVEERDDDLGMNSVEQGANDSAFALATWCWQLSPRIVLTQRASALYNRFQNLNTRGEELGRGRVAGGSYRARADWALSDRVLFETGSNIDVHRQQQRLQRFLPRPPLVTVTEQVDEGQGIAGGYAMVNATLRPDVTWSAGVRADASNLVGPASVSPFGTVGWDASQHWRVRAGAGRYAQFPSTLQSAGSRAGEDLTATVATHLDAAIERRLRPDLRFQVGLYQRLERDNLRLPDSEPRMVNGRPVSGSPATRWENRVDTTARGVELLLQRRRATGVSGWVSYAYATTRDRDVVTGERYDGDFDQRHTLNVYVSWRASHRFGASVKYRYGSGIPVDGYYVRGPDDAEGEPTYALGPYRNVARYPAYSRLDARVQRSFIRGQRRLTLFIEALNVANRHNFGPAGPGNAEPLFPILPSAGVSVEF